MTNFIYSEFLEIVDKLSANYTIPQIDNVFFPPFFEGGQPKDCEFMAISLESGAVGISYVLLPDKEKQIYNKLTQTNFGGTDPVDIAKKFGSSDPIENMLGLAAVNAICQHVIKISDYPLDFTSDSLGALDIRAGDRVGMVGFFPPLIKRIEETGAELTIIEKKESLVDQYSQFNITLDTNMLTHCNKVLCTSTTVYNNTLDNILAKCSPGARVSVIGPTAGYFPDPLFNRGVDVVGGTFVEHSEQFLRNLNDREKWSSSVRKFCFSKESYRSPIKK